MDPSLMPDYSGAVAAYTPTVTLLLQALKQSPRIDNRKLVYYAVALGIAVAFLGLLGTHRIEIVPGGINIDWMGVYRGTLEGIFGGASSPIVYQLQKALPEPLRPLRPGPDNFGSAANGSKEA